MHMFRDQPIRDALLALAFSEYAQASTFVSDRAKREYITSYAFEQFTMSNDSDWLTYLRSTSMSIERGYAVLREYILVTPTDGAARLVKRPKRLDDVPSLADMRRVNVSNPAPAAAGV